MDKSIDWIRLIYVGVLNADLEKQKFLAVCMGADSKEIEDMRYDEPDEKPKQIASIDELAMLGIGKKDRFKKVR